MPEIIVQAIGRPRARVRLEGDLVTVGRSRECDIFLSDPALSRHHAELRRGPAGWIVADLGSKNGTSIGRHRVVGVAPLADGDVITLGDYTLTFVADAEEAAEDRAPEGTQVYSARELSTLQPPAGWRSPAAQQHLLSVMTLAARELVVHRPLEEVFERTLALVFDALPAERGAIVLAGKRREPEVRAVRTRSGPAIERISRWVYGKVVGEKASLLLPRVDSAMDPGRLESLTASGARSAMSAPLWCHTVPDEDCVLGLVYVDMLAQSPPFTEDDLRVLTVLSNVAAAKIENVRLLEDQMEKQRLEADLSLAAEVQRSLLPRAAPILAGYDVAGVHRPCRGVGGDYYDYDLDGGRLLLALGDVAGKGMSAALLMTVLRAAVRDGWSRSSPGETVARLNRIMCANAAGNRYVTFVLARLETGTGRLTYVNAGHNPPLLVRADGTLETLVAGGTVLGLFEEAAFEEGTAQMEAGDTLLLYSDGISETCDDAGQEFGESRLAALARGPRGASLTVERVLADLERFSGGAKAEDDRTLVVVQRS